MQEAPEQASSPSHVACVEANLFAMFSFLRGWPRLEVHDDPDLLWSISDIPFPLFNSVLRARLPDGRVDAAIEEATERSKSRRVPLLWWTGPATQPIDLEDRLAHKGFQADEALGMAVDLDALPERPPTPPGVVVDQVTDSATMVQWCKVLCEGFEMPDFVGDAILEMSLTLGLGRHLPLRNYMAWREGEPIGVSSLFLGGGAAGIYNVATLPRARRTGIGAAMTSRGLDEALADGYHIAILHASQMATGVYRRLGFKDQCKIGQFVWGA